jgi:hypothetical protein
VCFLFFEKTRRGEGVKEEEEEEEEGEGEEEERKPESSRGILGNGTIGRR